MPGSMPSMTDENSVMFRVDPEDAVIKED